MSPRMPVADAHVDVLWKMEEDSVSFYGETVLQAGFNRLRTGGVTTQVFAVFVDPSLSASEQLHRVVRSLDIFQRQIVKPDCVGFAKSAVDMSEIHRKGELAGLLSIEGAACLRGDVGSLRVMYDLGVRGIGLTWNHANDLADGCREPRAAGLTGKGRSVVREMERLGMWVDISHLSDGGVKDVFSITDAPIMASHSNCRKIHDHPRNLPDAVIREIIDRHGWIGLTFEASFVSDPRTASIEAVFRHLDHILGQGGEDCVGLGSDFDGTSHQIPGLSDSSDYAEFQDRLLSRYGSNLTKKILHANFERYIKLVLG